MENFRSLHFVFFRKKKSDSYCGVNSLTWQPPRAPNLVLFGRILLVTCVRLFSHFLERFLKNFLSDNSQKKCGHCFCFLYFEILLRHTCVRVLEFTGTYFLTGCLGGGGQFSISGILFVRKHILPGFAYASPDSLPRARTFYILGTEWLFYYTVKKSPLANLSKYRQLIFPVARMKFHGRVFFETGISFEGWSCNGLHMRLRISLDWEKHFTFSVPDTCLYTYNSFYRLSDWNYMGEKVLLVYIQ